MDRWGTIADRCVVVPASTHGSYVGDILICDDGYRRLDGKCVVVPASTHGSYVGDILICDDGYRRVGEKCVPRG